jgi:hypothetical protein
MRFRNCAKVEPAVGRFDDAAGRRAFQDVFEGLISRMPGKPWAMTAELLTKDGFGGQQGNRESLCRKPTE